MKCRYYEIECHLEVVPTDCEYCPLWRELLTYRYKEYNKKLKKLKTFIIPEPKKRLQTKEFDISGTLE